MPNLNRSKQIGSMSVPPDLVMNLNHIYNSLHICILQPLTLKHISIHHLEWFLVQQKSFYFLLQTKITD